jgi:hypothetical protein
VSNSNEFEDAGSNMVAAILYVIRYCWFGGNPLGEIGQACIDSWKKFLHGYEIILWDESNWGVRCCDYGSEIFEAEEETFLLNYAGVTIPYRQAENFFGSGSELNRSIGWRVAA